MFLTFEQIKQITKGAARITMDESGYCKFFRFSKTEEDAYAAHPRAKDFFGSTLRPAGVRFALYTDSNFIAFDVSSGKPSSIAVAKFDVYENGAMVKEISVDYTYMNSARVRVELSKGEKLLEIYFPYNAYADIAKVELADGATLAPASRAYKMLSYGDSITHGSTASHPSLSYAPALARMLNADLTNKGIGGEEYFPNLIQEVAEEMPDWITVAYGTNDWKHCTPEEFDAKCSEFLRRLVGLYPTTPILVITPSWRADANIVTPFGAPTTEVDARVRAIAAPYENVTVIRGWDLTPHATGFYADNRLHPNDLGFAIYAFNLYREILPVLQKAIGYTFQ